uniref:(northern house mosquito) hypothetical protein n=1 Tax=Culex pipiens TaxID=7175 RepID=A0A8D8JY22_CULPI
MNPALKALLACALIRADLDNPCRALVPYVPRVSLLEVILAAAFSEQLSSMESDSEDDSSSSETASTSDSYPMGLLTQASTLSWTAADLASLDEHISEYYSALSDLEDEMDFTQHTLTDSQRAADQQARDEKEHAELMESLHETRQVVTADILQERCRAVVPYNPPVSLWTAEEGQEEDEPKAVVFHASLAEALTSSARGLKRKREKELPVSVDNVVWKKPRTSKVYRVKRRTIAAAVIPIPTAIELPVEEPEPVTANTTLSWGDEEVDFVDWNISCGEIEEREKERRLAEPAESSALVPYQPAPSKKVQQPRLVVMYGPIRSFWDPKLLSSPLLPLVNERKGQILKAQHNKLFRFTPYDKRDRKWRKVEQVVTIEEENTCRSLVIYTGSCLRLPQEVTVRYLLHPLLVGYLSFCRYATQHSTMRETESAINRGTKRKVDWQSGGSMKRSRAVNSAP